MKRHCALVALGLTAFVACAPTSESEDAAEPFTFSSFEQTTFVVGAFDTGGAPLQGALVSIENVYSATLDDDSEEGHRVYLRGVTDASGEMTGRVRLPSAVTEVDIVVQLAGYDGPWTDTALESELGYFAPSSRQTRTVAANIDLSVRLEN